MTRHILCANCQKPFPFKYLRKGKIQLCCSKTCDKNLLRKKNCIVCGKEYETKGHVSKYCSSRCRESTRSCTKATYECVMCDSEFRAKARNNKGYFCSRKCSGYFKRIFGNHQTYRVKALTAYPLHCNRCLLDDEEVLVAHHIDHNPQNNNVDNLEILCANCHHKHHWSGSSLSAFELQIAKDIKKIMPSISDKQHRLMEMVANDPKKAKELGIAQSVGKEFVAADKAKKKPKYKKPKMKK